MHVRIHREELVAILAELVSIKSVNPAYDPGSNEAGVARYVADKLTGWKISHRLHEVFPGRPNVLAEVPGRNPGRRLLFEAHMDTVSISGMEIPPFEPRIEENRLFGRGSCDTKGGLAAMLYALKTVGAEGPPSCTVLLAATVDEEYAFAGVRHLIDSGIKADASVVSEPTSLDTVIAHKGALRWRIITRGRAAHSSKVHLGINAISKMAGVIRAIDARLVPAYSAKSHPLLGPATLNIGLIEGGIQVNTVPDRCAIEVDRRMLPGESKESVWNEFGEVLDALRAADRELEVEMEEPKLYSFPLETDEHERVVTTAQEACRQTTGRGMIVGVPFGTDASKLSRVGIPSIVLGPGSIDQAHSAVEFVDLDQVVQAAEIYARMMLSF